MSSNLIWPTKTFCGRSSERLERESSKLEVASSNLVSRSNFFARGPIAKTDESTRLLSGGARVRVPLGPLKIFRFWVWCSGRSIQVLGTCGGGSNPPTQTTQQNLIHIWAGSVASGTLALQARRLSANLNRSTKLSKDARVV